MFVLRDIVNDTEGCENVQDRRERSYRDDRATQDFEVKTVLLYGDLYHRAVKFVDCFFPTFLSNSGATGHLFTQLTKKSNHTDGSIGVQQEYKENMESLLPSD